MPEPSRLSLIDETETQPIAAIRPVAGSGIAPAAQPAPSGRSRRGLGALLAVVGVVLLGIVVAGIFIPIVPHLIVGRPAAAHSPASARPSGAASSASSATPTPPASAQTLSAAGAALAAYVPPAFAGTCSSFTAAPVPGLVTAITCVPSGRGAPAHEEYYRYVSVTDLNAAFSHYAGGVSESGTCDQGGRRGTYAFAAGPIGGLWACYEDINRISQMIWTSTSLDILAAANDTGQTPQQLSSWFFSAAPTGPQ